MHHHRRTSSASLVDVGLGSVVSPGGGVAALRKNLERGDIPTFLISYWNTVHVGGEMYYRSPWSDQFQSIIYVSEVGEDGVISEETYAKCIAESRALFGIKGLQRDYSPIISSSSSLRGDDDTRTPKIRLLERTLNHVFRTYASEFHSCDDVSMCTSAFVKDLPNNKDATTPRVTEAIVLLHALATSTGAKWTSAHCFFLTQSERCVKARIDSKLFLSGTREGSDGIVTRINALLCETHSDTMDFLIDVAEELHVSSYGELIGNAVQSVEFREFVPRLIHIVLPRVGGAYRRATPSEEDGEGSPPPLDWQEHQVELLQLVALGKSHQRQLQTS